MLLQAAQKQQEISGTILGFNICLWTVLIHKMESCYRVEYTKSGSLKQSGTPPESFPVILIPGGIGASAWGMVNTKELQVVFERHIQMKHITDKQYPDIWKILFMKCKYEEELSVWLAHPHPPFSHLSREMKALYSINLIYRCCIQGIKDNVTPTFSIKTGSTLFLESKLIS